MITKRNIIRNILVTLLLLLAIGLLLYPFLSNYMFENRADSIVSTVEQSAENMLSEEQQKAVKAAEEYNRIIASGHVTLTDPFIADQTEEHVEDYESLLCMTEDGIMGSVEIPSIDVSLPIYHGTSSEVLEKGVGHLEGTSLPVGGLSTHTVLTGHTGLSRAKLFTDLTELQEGDLFFLKVMGKTLAYQVDQIKVVLPTELDALSVVHGKDYCTLLTCTPYGVNSHRLLVRGVRTDYEEAMENPIAYEKKKTESKWMAEYKRALFISMTFFIISLIILVIYRKVHKHHKNEERKI